ncbi:MAG: CBS domain-containing protein [Fidelibacterota bacterium]
MNRNVVYFSPWPSIEKIAGAISKNHFRRVPIVDNGKVVNITSRRDILKSAFRFLS